MRKTKLQQAVEACAIEVHRARISKPGGVGDTPVEAYGRYAAWLSPQFLRTVRGRVRELECRSVLDCRDAIAREYSNEFGQINKLKFCRARDEVLHLSLPELVAELRRLRFQRARARAALDEKAEFEVELNEALSLSQQFEAEMARRDELALAPKSDEVRLYRTPQGRKSETEKGRMEIEGQLRTPRGFARADSEHHIDEMAAEIYAAAPWLREVINQIWRHNRLINISRKPRIEIKPTLLVGPPGAGKTHFAELLCRIFGVPSARIDMSARAAAFDIAGSEYNWRSSAPGIPVRMLAASKYANPVIILDELDKAGRGDAGGDPVAALLPLLQRETARRYMCPFLQAEIDLGWINWIATANDIDRVPAPLLDRFRVFRVSAPVGEDLKGVVEAALAPAGADDWVICEVCQRIETGGMSLRALGRLADEFRALQQQPMLH